MHAARGRHRHQPNQQTSFPELVGRSAEEASAYIAGRGLRPILVKPNQPVTMDYCTTRVRIVTDAAGQVVTAVPQIG